MQTTRTSDPSTAHPGKNRLGTLWSVIIVASVIAVAPGCTSLVTEKPDATGQTVYVPSLLATNLSNQIDTATDILPGPGAVIGDFAAWLLLVGVGIFARIKTVQAARRKGDAQLLARTIEEQPESVKAAIKTKVASAVARSSDFHKEIIQ